MFTVRVRASKSMSSARRLRSSLILRPVQNRIDSPVLAGSFGTLGYSHRQMQKGCDAAGMEKIRLHDLRHSPNR